MGLADVCKSPGLKLETPSLSQRISNSAPFALMCGDPLCITDTEEIKLKEKTVSCPQKTDLFGSSAENIPR